MVGGWWLVVGGWWLVVGGWWLVVGVILVFNHAHCNNDHNSRRQAMIKQPALKVVRTTIFLLSFCPALAIASEPPMPSPPPSTVSYYARCSPIARYTCKNIPCAIDMYVSGHFDGQGKAEIGVPGTKFSFSISGSAGGSFSFPLSSKFVQNANAKGAICMGTEVSVSRCASNALECGQFSDYLGPNCSMMIPGIGPIIYPGYLSSC